MRVQIAEEVAAHRTSAVADGARMTDGRNERDT